MPHLKRFGNADDSLDVCRYKLDRLLKERGAHQFDEDQLRRYKHLCIIETRFLRAAKPLTN